jgi:dTDP-L-rhamnose 4-epimerase
MSNVLVTGGAGFIGSHTVDLLINEGYKVRIIDNLVHQVHQGKKPEYLNKEAEFILGDVSDGKGWKKWLEGIDTVIHLASMTGIAQSMYKPSDYCISNVDGTAQLFDCMINNKDIRANIKKIVVASSKTIYGEGAYKCSKHGLIFPELRSLEQLEKKEWDFNCPECGNKMEVANIPESEPDSVLSVYALSKYATERLALMIGQTLKIPTVAFRYFSVFGPRQSLSNPYTGVCSIFLSRIINNQQPIIFEDGNQIRDFIYVEDIARTNIMAIKKENFQGVYNLGSGIGQSIKNVSETINEILGKKIFPKITEEFRYGDTRNDLSDNSKIERDLGFKPKVSFKEGIYNLIEWSKKTTVSDSFEKAEKERIELLGK